MTSQGLVFFVSLAMAVAATYAAELGLLAVVSRAVSGEYLVNLNIGSPPQSELLLLDLSQNYIWTQCSASRAGASSFTPSLSSTFTHVVHGKSPVFVNLPGVGRLPMVADTFTFNVTNGRNPGMSDAEVKRVHFLCSSSGPSRSQGASGMAGLGRGKLSLPSQIAARRGLPRRFAYCLTGVTQRASPLWLSSGNYALMPFVPQTAIGELTYTPFAKATKQKPGYRISLQDIKVENRSIKVNPKVFRGGLEVSTTEPYTKLVRPAYEALRDAFLNVERGIPRMAPTAPFDICFNSTWLGSTRLGPGVNIVTFVFADGNSWSIVGANSMVFVSEYVACFGFLDAGPAPAHSILGTYQQQDIIVEFDLDKNRLGFTGSLLGSMTTCSNFNFTTVDI